MISFSKCEIPDDFLEFTGSSTQKVDGDLQFIENYPFPKRSSKVNIVVGSDLARKGIESSSIKGIINFEQEVKDSLHYRKSGLNQVLCKIATKNGTLVIFNLSRIITGNKIDVSSLVGKMRQNVRICRKFKVKMGLVIVCETKYDLRSKAEIISLGKFIGMTEAEARNSIQNIQGCFSITKL